MNSPRKECKARKLDRQKALDLHTRGISATEIAKHQGVAHSTVWRFLQRMQPEIAGVEAFKKNRADVLARIQAKSLDAQERIIDTLEDAVIGAMTAGQKNGALIALNNVQGTIFDKERLERGESTQNISTISKMVESRVGSLYKRKSLEPKQEVQKKGAL